MAMEITAGHFGLHWLAVLEKISSDGKRAKLVNPKIIKWMRKGIVFEDFFWIILDEVKGTVVSDKIRKIPRFEQPANITLSEKDSLYFCLPIILGFAAFTFLEESGYLSALLEDSPKKAKEKQKMSEDPAQIAVLSVKEREALSKETLLLSLVREAMKVSRKCEKEASKKLGSWANLPLDGITFERLMNASESESESTFTASNPSVSSSSSSDSDNADKKITEKRSEMGKSMEKKTPLRREKSIHEKHGKTREKSEKSLQKSEKTHEKGEKARGKREKARENFPEVPDPDVYENPRSIITAKEVEMHLIRERETRERETRERERERRRKEKSMEWLARTSDESILVGLENVVGYKRVKENNAGPSEPAPQAVVFEHKSPIGKKTDLKQKTTNSLRPLLSNEEKNIIEARKAVIEAALRSVKRSLKKKENETRAREDILDINIEKQVVLADPSKVNKYISSNSRLKETLKQGKEWRKRQLFNNDISNNAMSMNHREIGSLSFIAERSRRERYDGPPPDSLPATEAAFSLIENARFKKTAFDIVKEGIYVDRGIDVVKPAMLNNQGKFVRPKSSIS